MKKEKIVLRRRITKKTVKKANKTFVIPLTFGKGIKLSIVEMKRMLLHKRWHYVGMISVSVLIVASSMFVYKNFTAKSATYGWIQTDWSGGVATTTATHTNNQTNWTQYTSKTDNLSTAGGMLTQTSASPVAWTETDNADFNDNGTYTNTYNDTGNNSVRSKKPDGLGCATGGECLNGRCASNVCANLWYTGACAGIGVYYIDSGVAYWKTSETSCVSPQCSAGNLVADNAVDFSLYLARNVCKALGGRLPSLVELSCIRSNIASYGNNFQANAYYWSSLEYNAGSAYMLIFSDGSTNVFNKGSYLYVRCVRGQ